MSKFIEKGGKKMKKLIAVYLISFVLTPIGYSQEVKRKQLKPIQTEFKKQILPENMPPDIRENLKEYLEIRKRMREIEKQTIENDPELKNLWDEIVSLKREMRKKLDEKLKDNEEYQNLRKRLFEMWKEFKEKERR
jgi:siroheme synthase (precorrin-2 oxidase/ferrochelatase)